jgi:MFS family permease
MRTMQGLRTVDRVFAMLVLGGLLAGVVVDLYGLVHAHNWWADPINGEIIGGYRSPNYQSYGDYVWVSLALVPLVPLAWALKWTRRNRYKRAALFAFLTACAMLLSLLVAVGLYLEQLCLNVPEVCAGKYDPIANDAWAFAFLVSIAVGVVSLVWMLVLAFRPERP